jgi:hypothetical protein
MFQESGTLKRRASSIAIALMQQPRSADWPT